MAKEFAQTVQVTDGFEKTQPLNLSSKEKSSASKKVSSSLWKRFRPYVIAVLVALVFVAGQRHQRDKNEAIDAKEGAQITVPVIEIK